MLDLGPLQQKLTACPDGEGLRLVFREFLLPLGFNASACGGFWPARQGARPFFYFQDWPQDWLDLYIRENFVAHDYGVAEARKRFMPFTWLEAKEMRELSQGEARIWQAVLDYGWRDGFNVPVHGPAGYFGLVTMATEQPEISADLRHHLHLAALIVHDQARRLAGEDAVLRLAESLTAREGECLRWVAAGLSDGEIAEKLSIGSATVKDHIERARRKLGAATRAQALLQAYLAGLV